MSKIVTKKQAQKIVAQCMLISQIRLKINHFHLRIVSKEIDKANNYPNKEVSRKLGILKRMYKNAQRGLSLIHGTVNQNTYTSLGHRCIVARIEDGITEDSANNFINSKLKK